MVKQVQLAIEFIDGTEITLAEFIYKLQTEFLDEEYPGAEITQDILNEKRRRKKSSY